jgi:hypothetical protein
MSESMLNVPLKELTKLRVTCHGKIPVTGAADVPCGMVYEVPLQHLAAAFPNCACPVCGTSFRQPPRKADPFGPFATALDTLLKLPQAEVGFLISAPPPATDNP